VAPVTSLTSAASLDNAVVDPTGKYLYVVDFGNGSTAGQIFAFNIIAGGVIGAQIGTALPTGIAPGHIVIDPTGVLIATENNGDTPTGTIAVRSGNWRRYNGHYTPHSCGGASTVWHHLLRREPVRDASKPSPGIRNDSRQQD
jgi:DNA-binding beta-propeller fold protein YncE